MIVKDDNKLYMQIIMLENDARPSHPHHHHHHHLSVIMLLGYSKCVILYLLMLMDLLPLPFISSPG